MRLILYVHNSTKKYNADAANIINQISEKNKISKDWEWKRIWTSKNKTFEEIDDKKIEEWIKSVLREKDKYEQSKGL